MVHSSEGSDAAWLVCHGLPGVLAGIEEVGVGGEDEMAEEVVLEVLPGFFGWIALRGVGRRKDERDVLWYFQFGRTMPTGTVGDDGGMDLWGQRGADLVEVQLHHGGIGARQNQPDGGVALRTEGAEDISIVIACVEGHRRTRPFGGPAVSASSFLTDAGFVLTPEFNGFFGMRGGDFLKFGREVFLKAFIALRGCAGCCGRPLIHDCPNRCSRAQTPARLE